MQSLVGLPCSKERAFVNLDIFFFEPQLSLYKFGTASSPGYPALILFDIQEDAKTDAVLLSFLLEVLVESASLLNFNLKQC